jgi:cysteine synthase A
MNIKKSLPELIGNTPLLELSRYNKEKNNYGVIIGKLESFNPMSSVKDRIANAMIEKAEAEGLINKETVIVEPTSGNTGIGLAFVAASKGYKLILTMPDTMSEERRKLLKALGAELVLTPGSKGMNGAIDEAKIIASKYKDAFIPQQFENSANPEVHRRTTGQEIINDTDGTVDIFVAGVGTGGTITGVGAALKAHNPNIQIVAVEPMNSAVISGENPGPHKIQGIGAGFIPKNLNVDIIDEIIKVTNDDAFETAREVAKIEGLLVGISSGAALYAATQLARKPENEGKKIVVIFPSHGERYLSTPLFE